MDQSGGVILYGADTNIGSKILKGYPDDHRRLIARSSGFFESEQHPAKAVAEDIRVKKPEIVINCLLEPDTGRKPAAPANSYVATAAAMVQQCRTRGLKLIHCSSARMYGQLERMQGRETYVEYDPPLMEGVDPWRPILHAVEMLIFQQSALFNTEAMATMRSGFTCHILRFGHVFDRKPVAGYTFDACTLDECLRRMIAGDRKFFCEDPSVLVSPVTAKDAADAVLMLLVKDHGVPAGTYHVGSPDHVTVARLLSYAAQRLSMAVDVGPTVRREHTGLVPDIYGVDADQAIDSKHWRLCSGMRLPAWHAVVDSVLRGRALMPAII